MKKVKIIFAAMLFFGATAAQAVTDLSDELESGDVALESVAGNGGSSGTVLTGYLRNQSGSSKRIGVDLARPLYLVNSGFRQNMVATQVYNRDGGYFSDGKKSFIELKSNQRAPIVFVAYCADFEKENPTAEDSFTIGKMPGNLNRVAKKVREYVSRNPNAEVTIAAQLAFWLVQGESTSDIRQKFEFSQSDEMLGRQFAR